MILDTWRKVFIIFAVYPLPPLLTVWLVCPWEWDRLVLSEMQSSPSLLSENSATLPVVLLTFVPTSLFNLLLLRFLGGKVSKLHYCSITLSAPPHQSAPHTCHLTAPHTLRLSFPHLSAPHSCQLPVPHTDLTPFFCWLVLLPHNPHPPPSTHYATKLTLYPVHWLHICLSIFHLTSVTMLSNHTDLLCLSLPPNSDFSRSAHTRGDTGTDHWSSNIALGCSVGLHSRRRCSPEQHGAPPTWPVSSALVSARSGHFLFSGGLCFS